MTHPDRLSPDHTAHLSQIRNADAELDRLTTHVRGFATMMTELRGEDLEQWITDVEQDTLAPMASFAPQPAPRSGRRPRRPDPAAQLRPGRRHHQQIKMLKRQMFGRASFDLLRTRVLHAC
jgi:transposase